MTKTIVWIALVFLVLIAASMDAEDAELQLAHYCEMVELHQKDGSRGWPDYKGIYEKECRQKTGSRMSS